MKDENKWNEMRGERRERERRNTIMEREMARRGGKRGRRER